MKKIKTLLLLPLLLLGLTSCTNEPGEETYDIGKEFTAVHIYDYGCVPCKDCKIVIINNHGYKGSVTVRYEDSIGNVLQTSSFALVKGSCLVCSKGK